MMTGAWQGHQIYLTGGTGFIGTEVAKRLVDGGAVVTCLTRDATRATHLEELGCSVVEGNVLDPGTIEIPDTVDTVVHGAAWVAYGIPRQKKETFYKTNVEGTKHVLQAAKEAGADHFCHISSVAAVGPTPAGLYTEERAEKGRLPMYHSLYEETKHQAHMHVLENAGTMRVTLPMPGVVVGLGSDTEGLIRGYAQGKLWGVRGDNPTAIVHVKDTADGIVAAMSKGKGPYILVDQNLTFRQLLHVLQEASGIPPPSRSLPIGLVKALAAVIQTPYHLAGKVPPISKELIDNLELPYTYSSQKAVEELGWQPDLVGHLEEDFETLAG